MVSPNNEPALPNPLATCESLVFDDYDRFWLSPVALQKTVDLINNSSYPMMDVGAATVNADNASYRDRIAAVLFPGEGHESDAHKIFDIGYNYGRVAANYTAQERLQVHDKVSDEQTVDSSQMLNETLMQEMENVASDVSFEGDASGIELFQRLREMEIRHAGSDILGLSLAIAQDHINWQSSLYSHDANDAAHIQSLLYAGALVGGIAYSKPEAMYSGVPGVRIVRSVASGGDAPVARIEFDRDDSLIGVIDYALSNQLHFTFQVRSGKPVMLVQRGGAQLGPNAISLPVLYDKKDPNVIGQDMGMDDIVFIETTNPDEAKRIEAYSVRDFMALEKERRVIKGFASEDYCVGAYLGNVHPNAQQLVEMTAQLFSKDTEDVPYACDYELKDQQSAAFSKRNSMLILAGMLVTVWSNDAVAYLKDSPDLARPAVSIAADVTILAAWGMLAALKRVRAANRRQDGIS